MNVLNVALGAFVLAVFGVHVLLFTKWKSKTDRFWKATDYFWLLVAILGLWGTIARQEQEHKTHLISDLERSLEWEYAAQQVEIEQLARKAFLITAMKSEVPLNNEGRPGLRSFLMSIQQAENLSRELAINRPYNKHPAELDKVISELRLDGREEMKNIGDKADTMRLKGVADENHLDTLRAEVTSPLLGWARKWVSPVLLALALAVRVTRVTAEVCVLKRGESWSANQPGQVFGLAQRAPQS
jgi:hypothetical protein